MTWFVEQVIKYYNGVVQQALLADLGALVVRAQHYSRLEAHKHIDHVYCTCMSSQDTGHERHGPTAFIVNSTMAEHEMKPYARQDKVLCVMQCNPVLSVPELQYCCIRCHQLLPRCADSKLADIAALSIIHQCHK
jgi:hypothetical protein